MKRGKDTIDNLVLMKHRWGIKVWRHNFHSDEGKIKLKGKITGSERYLKLERYLQGKVFLEEILCDMAWRRHVERIKVCHGKQNTLVGKTLVRKKRNYENLSAMWEKIMDKGCFKIKIYSRGKQYNMKEKHPHE